MQPGLYKSVCGSNVSSAVKSVRAKAAEQMKGHGRGEASRDARGPRSETADLQEFPDNVISKK